MSSGHSQAPAAGQRYETEGAERELQGGNKGVGGMASNSAVGLPLRRRGFLRGCGASMFKRGWAIGLPLRRRGFRRRDGARYRERGWALDLPLRRRGFRR